MKERVKAWLDKAQDDLNFAKVGFRDGFYSQVCFLSQQCIEKALKGSLVALNRPYPKSHSLRELAGLLPEIKLKNEFEGLVIVDGYYIPSRYPDAVPGMGSLGPPTKHEAHEALELAEKMIETITDHLKMWSEV